MRRRSLLEAQCLIQSVPEVLSSDLADSDGNCISILSIVSVCENGFPLGKTRLAITFSSFSSCNDASIDAVRLNPENLDPK